MKKLLSTTFLVALCLFLFAQDSTGTGTGTSTTWSIGTVTALIAGIYEAVVRVIPTVKNLSIVTWTLKRLAEISAALNVKKAA